MANRVSGRGFRHRMQPAMPGSSSTITATGKARTKPRPHSKAGAFVILSVMLTCASFASGTLICDDTRTNGCFSCDNNNFGTAYQKVNCRCCDFFCLLSEVSDAPPPWNSVVFMQRHACIVYVECNLACMLKVEGTHLYMCMLKVQSTRL